MDQVINQLKIVVSKGTCSKKQVGCVITVDNEIVVQAANGRPGKQTCINGYCERCKAADLFSRGRDHDLCSCLHAEQNAICEVARKGISIQNGWLYSTYQPCLTCLKLSVGSGIAAIRYIEPWLVPKVDRLPNLESDYTSLEELLKFGSEQIKT